MPQDALSLFVDRQLTDQATRTYDAPLPPLHAMTMFPPAGGVALGAANYTRSVYRHFGRSQWAGSSADDLPLVGVGVIEDVYNVGMHGVQYSVSVKEARRAQFGGVNISDKKALSGRRAIFEFNNDVAIFGSVAKKITGLLSIPYIPRVSIDISLFQAGADPDATLAALYSLEEMIEVNTEQAEQPDTIGLATVPYNYIAKTRASTLTDKTILAVFLENAEYVKSASKMRELNGAGPNGEDMIWCGTYGNDRMEHNIPDPLTILAPQPLGLITKVPMISETAGMISEFPYSQALAEVS